MTKLPPTLVTVLALFVVVACGSPPPPPTPTEPPHLAAVRVEVDAVADQHGIRTDGSQVEIWGTLDVSGSTGPASHLELTFEERGPGASQRCVASWELPRHSPGSHHFHESGTLVPPCHPPAAGAYFEETVSVSWPDGQHVEAMAVFLPLALGGDDRLHTTGTEGDLAQQLAASPLGAPGQRPTPAQAATSPALEALLDELATIAPLFSTTDESPAAARAPDTTCPPGLATVAMTIELGELRDLAAAAEGSIASDPAAIDHRIVYDVLTDPPFGSLEVYAHGYPPGPDVASAFPAPAAGSYAITLVTRWDRPSANMETTDPNARERHGTLQPGIAEGRVFVVDRVGRRIACEGAFHAESSDVVRGRADRELLLEDFHTNVGEAVRATLARIGAGS